MAKSSDPVNTVQLAEALRGQGFDIDRKSLKIKDEPIRELGTFEAEANLYKGREAKLQI